MKIGLFGATGNIGQRVLDEALRRGHEVTAIVRDPSHLNVSPERLSVVIGDATNAASVAASIGGHDVVIGSISGRRDGNIRAIGEAARALLAGAEQAGVERLLWVGGAGSLEVAPGVRLIDTPEFPEAYKAEALAGLEVLEMLRAAETKVEWTYLSPAAEIAPGTRTGIFRLGGNALVTDADGRSRISMEDFAVALLDEVETPLHLRQRFTLAYELP